MVDGKAPTQDVLELDELNISKTVMDILCKEEELE